MKIKRVVILAVFLMGPKLYAAAPQQVDAALVELQHKYAGHQAEVDRKVNDLARKAQAKVEAVKAEIEREKGFLRRNYDWVVGGTDKAVDYVTEVLKYPALVFGAHAFAQSQDLLPKWEDYSMWGNAAALAALGSATAYGVYKAYGPNSMVRRSRRTDELEKERILYIKAFLNEPMRAPTNIKNIQKNLDEIISLLQNFKQNDYINNNNNVVPVDRNKFEEVINQYSVIAERMRRLVAELPATFELRGDVAQYACAGILTKNIGASGRELDMIPVGGYESLTRLKNNLTEQLYGIDLLVRQKLEDTK